MSGNMTDMTLFGVDSYAVLDLLFTAVEELPSKSQMSVLSVINCTPVLPPLTASVTNVMGF